MSCVIMHAPQYPTGGLLMANIDRRNFLISASTGVLELSRQLCAQTAPPPAPGSDIPRIVAGSSYGKGITFFDPAGLYVQVGQRVQFAGTGRRGVVAYHPSIDNHELRIPENAKPFDSRTMPSQGGMFEWKFEVEG